MNLIIFVAAQLVSVLEIIIVVSFLVRSLGYKDDFCYGRKASVIIVGLLFLISQKNGVTSNSHFIIIVVDIVLLFVFCRIVLKGNIQMQMLSCLFPFLVIAVTNIFLVQIFAIIRSISVNYYINMIDLYHLLGAVISKIILWYALRKIRCFIEDKILYLSKRYYFMVNLLIVSMVIIELLLFYVINIKIYNQSVRGMLIAVSIGIALISIYVAYSIFAISEQNSKVVKYELLKMQNQEMARRLDEFERADTRIRQLRHDYKNHCMNMETLLEEKQYLELANYLQNLSSRYLSSNKEFVHTDNPILDAVINKKVLQCQENNIVITCYLSGELKGVRGIEVATILFNLLDNAIEAKWSDSISKQIELKIIREKEGLNIVIKNTIQESVLAANEQLATGKADKKLHGIGHVTVEELVKEMDGMVEYYEENQMFCAHVFLPVKDSDSVKK